MGDNTQGYEGWRSGVWAIRLRLFGARDFGGTGAFATLQKWIDNIMADLILTKVER